MERGIGFLERQYVTKASGWIRRLYPIPAEMRAGKNRRLARCLPGRICRADTVHLAVTED